MDNSHHDFHRSFSDFEQVSKKGAVCEISLGECQKSLIKIWQSGLSQLPAVEGSQSLILNSKLPNECGRLNGLISSQKEMQGCICDK